MVHIGHDQYAARAFTNDGADVAGLYAETPAPAKAGFVLRDGKAIALETRPETIRVRKTGSPSPRPARSRSASPSCPATARCWTTSCRNRFRPSLPKRRLAIARSVPVRHARPRALASLATITSWAGFVANADDWEVGAQNTVFADVGGDVGYLATGRFPHRPWADAEFDAIRPLPGDGSAESRATPISMTSARSTIRHGASSPRPMPTRPD